jgi:HK97 family phage portal protein
MGFLAQRVEEIRNRSDWLNADDSIDGPWQGRQTPSGVRVNRDVALGLPTIWRCVDLLASAVSQSPWDVVVKIGPRRFPEFNQPEWLTTPNPLDPTFTIDDYFSQVALALLFDGNYFTAVYPNVLDPIVLTPLDPGRVRIKPGPRYEILDDYGQVSRVLGPMEMLHGTWLRPAGALRGISPLEALRRSIGSAVAAEDFAGRFFGQGASLAFGVEVPGELDDTKKDKLRDALKRKYAGLNNSHAVGVLTGGAKFVTGLAPTPEQAQMLATRKLSSEELCRPYGVPPIFVGSQEPGASSYASAEVYDKQFAERAVLPLAVRIEIQHNRMLTVPDNITDPNATVSLRCNLDAISRANILTRYQAYNTGVQGGFMTPNRARALEDEPPLPGGDELYMQRQMVPITDLGTSAPIPGAPVDVALPSITPGQETAA